METEVQGYNTADKHTRYGQRHYSFVVYPSAGAHQACFLVLDRAHELRLLELALALPL
jgi:hypothetical protein